MSKGNWGKLNIFWVSNPSLYNLYKHMKDVTTLKKHALLSLKIQNTNDIHTSILIYPSMLKIKIK